MTKQELKDLKEALRKSGIAKVEEPPYKSVERENMSAIREREQQSYEE